MLIMLGFCPGHTITNITILVIPAWSTSVNVLMWIVRLPPPLGGREMMVTAGLILTVLPWFLSVLLLLIFEYFLNIIVCEVLLVLWFC